MLILRRKKNESILIGGNIRITIVECANDGVRIAIDAPRQISILREELSILEQENREAAAPDTTSISNLQDSLKHLLKAVGNASEAEDPSAVPEDTAETEAGAAETAAPESGDPAVDAMEKALLEAMKKQ